MEIKLLPDNEFWQIVDELDWKTLSGKRINFDKEQIKNMAKYRNKMILFCNTYEIKFNSLEQAIKKEETLNRPLGVGDDGRMDLLSDIIGLGQDFYNQVLVNPKIAFEKASKNDFGERFSYLFPYSNDYEKLNPNYFKEQLNKESFFPAGTKNLYQIIGKYEKAIKSHNHTVLKKYHSDEELKECLKLIKPPSIDDVFSKRIKEIIDLIEVYIIIFISHKPQQSE